MATRTKPNLQDDAAQEIEAMLAHVARYQIDQDFIAQVKEGRTPFSQEEVRALYDLYDDCQRMRIRQGNRVAARKRLKRPVEVVSQHYFDQFRLLEDNAARNLILYAKASPRRVVHWALGVQGVGPILVAALSAHIDVRQAPHVSSLWRFAGYNPEPRDKPKRGEKRHYCAALKRICHLVGKSFVYVSGKPGAVYGRIYRERKALEVERNVAKRFKDQAAAALEEKEFKKPTKAKKCYEAGVLPDAHIDARARRYAVKMFLSHWYEVEYEEVYGKAPENPWIIGKQGHTHWRRAKMA